MANSRYAITAGPMAGMTAVPTWGPYAEEASQDYKKGAPLKFDTTSWEIEEGLGLFAGIAQHDASGTAGTDVYMIPTLPGMVFEGTLDDSSAIGTHALVAGNMGDSYDLVEDSDDIYYIDHNTKGSGGDHVRIIGFKDPVGTVMARVYFVFILDQLHYNTNTA